MKHFVNSSLSELWLVSGQMSCLEQINLHTANAHRVSLSSLVPVKGNLNALATKAILYNCELQCLWQQFAEEPHMGLIVRCSHTFGYRVQHNNHNCELEGNIYTFCSCLLEHMHVSNNNCSILNYFLEISYWPAYQQPVHNLANHTNYFETQMPIVPQHCLLNNMPVSAPTLAQLPYNTGMHNPTCSLFVYHDAIVSAIVNSNTRSMNYLGFQNRH